MHGEADPVSVRSMLARVDRLERARISPSTRMLGSPDQFEADMQAGVDAGVYDRLDMPAVVASIQRWMREIPWHC